MTMYVIGVCPTCGCVSHLDKPCAEHPEHTAARRMVEVYDAAERDRLREALNRLAHPHPSWAMPDVRNIANQALRGSDSTIEQRRALEDAILADVLPALARRRELIAWTGSEAEHRNIARIAIRFAIGRYHARTPSPTVEAACGDA